MVVVGLKGAAIVQLAILAAEIIADQAAAPLTFGASEAAIPLDEQMGYDERLRLLYVACTRACDHLVVSIHRVARKSPARKRSFMVERAQAWIEV